MLMSLEITDLRQLQSTEILDFFFFLMQRQSVCFNQHLITSSMLGCQHQDKTSSKKSKSMNRKDTRNIQQQTKLEEKPECQIVTLLPNVLLTVFQSAENKVCKESSCTLNIRFLYISLHIIELLVMTHEVIQPFLKDQLCFDFMTSLTSKFHKMFSVYAHEVVVPEFITL